MALYCLSLRQAIVGSFFTYCRGGFLSYLSLRLIMGGVKVSSSFARHRGELWERPMLRPQDGYGKLRWVVVSSPQQREGIEFPYLRISIIRGVGVLNLCASIIMGVEVPNLQTSIGGTGFLNQYVLSTSSFTSLTMASFILHESGFPN